MSKGNKHLTASQREKILIGVENNNTSEEIGKDVGKHRTCISKELKKNRKLEIAARFKNGNTTMCANVRDCPIANSRECTRNCEHFELKECKRHTAFPYVCNGCDKLNGKGCTVNTHKYFYSAADAHFNYEVTLSESRRGIHISLEEFKKLDEIINDGVAIRKNSINHTIRENESVIKVCKQTIYNYINDEYLTIRRIDLPRAVRFKPPKSKHTAPKREKNWVKGRTYNDYLEHIKNAQNEYILFEMDTVVGKVDESDCFLTIAHPESRLMFIFKLESKNTICVRKKLYHFLNLVHKYMGLIDVVILTDRGAEFHEPDRLEVHDDTGEVLCKVFYCDPYNSCQKPHVENIHTGLRRMVPKGKTLKQFNQNDCNYMMSNLNSYFRESLDGDTPFNVFSRIYNASILHRLKIKKLPANEVSLKKITK